MKRFISFLLIATTFLGMISGLTGCAETDLYLSRSQWITELAERFGMDSTVSESDYFMDVGKDDTYYISVQSCADWGVLSNEHTDRFEPDKDATVEFALETAILASGVDIGEMSYVDYALSEGILKDKSFMSVRGRLTAEIAEQIINWTQDIYLNGAVEPRAIVEYKDIVRNLNEETGITKNKDGEYVVSEGLAQSLKSGDLLMMPDSDYPDGVGVKVSEVVINNDGTATVITTEPEIEELIANMDVAGAVSFEIEDIQLADGVSFSSSVDPMAFYGSNDGVAHITTLQDTSQQKMQAVNLSNGIIPDINLNVNFTKGTIAINPEWDSAVGLLGSFSYAPTDPNNPNSDGEQQEAGVLAEKTSVIPVGSSYGNSAYKNQQAINAYKDGQITLDELKKELNLTKDQQEKNPKIMQNKFSAGYEVVGGLKISDIKITTEATYNPITGIKASFAVDYNVTFSGGVKGKLSESLNLMTVRVPIATGVTVDVKFYLCLDANGEVMVKVAMDSSTKYSLEGTKVKKTTKTSKPDVTTEINICVDFGPKIAAELCVAGYPLIDVGIKAVIRGKVSAQANYQTSFTTGVDEENRETITVKRQTLWTVRGDIYIPIVTLEANVNPKSVANKLKLSGSWTIIDEDKAKHFGSEEPEPIIIWSEEFTLIGDEATEENTETTAPDTQEGDAIIGEQLTIDTYYINLNQGQSAQISVVTIPKGYTAADLVWTSSNTDVVTVSGGKISVVGGGIATITVRTSDGQYYQQCSISVNETVQSVVGISFVSLPVVMY